MATNEMHEETFGLVANGSSGAWDVDLDESLEGEQRWFLQISGPRCYLHFGVENPDIVEKTLRFLERMLSHALDEATQEGRSPNDELELTRHGSTEVSLVSDHGLRGGCVVSIGGEPNLQVEIALEQPDLRSLVAALLQVRDELIENGLLMAKADAQ